MTTDTDFHAFRKTGIGGSDVAGILHLSKYVTELDVYLQKIGEAQPTPDNDAMLFGRLLEPVLLKHYEKISGQQLIEERATLRMRSKEHAFMIANLDGLTQSGRIVEIKTARSSDGWGETGTDEIPDLYLTQVQHYMAVGEAEIADVAVLIGGSDFRIYTVERDDALIDLLVEKEKEFWNRVISRTPPEPFNSADLMKLYPKSLSSAVEATPDMLEKIAILSEINGQIKSLEELSEIKKDEIKKIIGETSGITMDGKPLVTWKSQDSSRFDQARFKADHPDLFAQYKLNSSTRVFRLTK